MPDDVAIEVNAVHKDFVLPHEKTSTVKGLFTSMYRKRDHSVERQHALHDINFQVKKGEFFGIVGRNGSGKSTLLKILAGIYQPTQGSVRTRGKLVPFIELGVGFNPELTGRENVYLNGAMLGFSNDEVTAMYDDIVAFAELERFMDQKLKNYSSGMQVRLAFSMAVKAKAEILVIDEVLAVGDASFQRKCLEYFRQLKRDNITVIFVSHDMDSIREFCDRAILIEKSKIVYAGESEEAADQYLKMFFEEIEQQVTEKNDESDNKKRWGSRAVSFESIEIEPRVLTDATEGLKFGGILRAVADERNLIVGFRITDSTGKGVTGTNSRLLRIKDLEVKAAEALEFSWYLPNIFSNGKYKISLAAVREDDTPLDVWDEALKFDVVKSLKTPYVVAPKTKLTVRVRKPSSERASRQNRKTH
jgi:ABC-2 type transport system ATP-binding protein